MRKSHTFYFDDAMSSPLPEATLTRTMAAALCMFLSASDEDQCAAVQKIAAMEPSLTHRTTAKAQAIRAPVYAEIDQPQGKYGI